MRPMSGIAPRLRFRRTTPSNQSGHALLSLTCSTPWVCSRMNRSTSACFVRRAFGSFGFPISRKKKTPSHGMKKIASSHAMPAVGRRFRGTTTTATMRTTMSAIRTSRAMTAVI
ncbi:hypothetical protein GCM10025870_25100 [Agromyces marinus]|uniref:Uncharacterized protein n=1 Tax=Agromyces marinus TaxID=1389020 RepID=A0ABN6YDE9_9MICO|nr:hypothetical protein GCM10025870_25100 [Agromyces marinus]